MEWCKIVAIPLYSNKALKKEDGSPSTNQTKFRSLIGSLLYLTTTQLDIMFVTCLLSRFMQSPTQVHYGAAKRVLNYLQGTKNYGIWYSFTPDSKLIRFTDGDWTRLVDDMKSISGYTFTLETWIFSWAVKKQATVAQSSTKALYIAVALTTSQVIWLKRLLEDVREPQNEATKIYCNRK